MRRRWVAQVSHDLRTPLASLGGYLESLQMKEAELSPEERTQYLAVALRQSCRLSRLVEELFELASLEAREKKPDIEPFAAAELVQDVVQKQRLRAEQQAVNLEMQSPDALPFVLADIALTERVLDNLIGNALDHTLEGGRIAISLQVVGERLQISITDSGSGIAEVDLPHLFEPFYRGGSVDGGESHAGLGLAIAHRIMELQQGAIRVDSRIGEGAVFTIDLPIKPV